MEAADHGPAEEDVHPGVEDLVPGGHAQVDEQLLFGGSRQLPAGAHGRRAAQHRLGDEDLRGIRAVSPAARQPLPRGPRPPARPSPFLALPCCVTRGGLPGLSELQLPARLRVRVGGSPGAGPPRWALKPPPILNMSG